MFKVWATVWHIGGLLGLGICKFRDAAGECSYYYKRRRYHHYGTVAGQSSDMYATKTIMMGSESQRQVHLSFMNPFYIHSSSIPPSI